MTEECGRRALLTEGSVLDEIQPLLLPAPPTAPTGSAMAVDVDAGKSQAKGKQKRGQGKSPVDKENQEDKEEGSMWPKKPNHKKAKKNFIVISPEVLPTPKPPSLPPSPLPHQGPPVLPTVMFKLDLNIDLALQVISFPPAKEVDALDGFSDDCSSSCNAHALDNDFSSRPTDSQEDSYMTVSGGQCGVSSVPDDAMMDTENMLLHPPFRPSDEALLLASSWRPWFKLFPLYFETYNLGSWWKDVVLGYKVFEGRVGFVNLKGGNHALPNQHCPGQVARWIKNYRKLHPEIPSDFLATFASAWWAWWIAMQLTWRRVEGKEGPLELVDRV